MKKKALAVLLTASVIAGTMGGTAQSYMQMKKEK